MNNPLNRRVVQMDNYEIVELWADGKLQMSLKWNRETNVLESFIGGPMSLASQEPGIIRALKEEDLLDVE